MIRSSQRSTLISGALHALAIVVVLFFTAVKAPLPRPDPRRDTTVFVPRMYRPTANVGGGGGGQNSPTPPTRGLPPREAPRVFTPPLLDVHMETPKLSVAPSTLSASETPAPNYQIGVDFGALGPPSGGPGTKGGIGGKDGTGVGPTGGPGRDGSKPGPGGQPPPKKMTLPELLTKTEPEYSEDARRAKLQGTVELTIVVGTDGRVSSVEVLRGLGLGLDEKAVESVKQWRFRPATGDGKPIPASALVSVTFRLL